MEKVFPVQEIDYICRLLGLEPVPLNGEVITILFDINGRVRLVSDKMSFNNFL